MMFETFHRGPGLFVKRWWCHWLSMKGASLKLESFTRTGWGNHAQQLENSDFNYNIKLIHHPISGDDITHQKWNEKPWKKTRMKKLLLTKDSSLDAARTVRFIRSGWHIYIKRITYIHTEGSVDIIVSLYSGFRKISIKQLATSHDAVTCGWCRAGKCDRTV